MNFEPGRYYLRGEDGKIFRCEGANRRSALLHVTDCRNVLDESRRVFLPAATEGWSVIPRNNEAPLRATYIRDMAEEFGVELDEQGAIFRRQYHLNPYLSMIGEREIQERLDGISDNLVRYDECGTPRLLTMNEGFRYWQRKLEEIAEELRNRKHSSLLQGNESRKVIKLGHDLRTKLDYERFAPWGRLPKPLNQSTPILFKFGQRSHLADAWRNGRVRVNPASFYANPELDVARRDNKELSLMFRPSQTGLPIEVTKAETGGKLFDTSTASLKQMAIEIGGGRDYYVWCCAKVYEPRFYIDFRADACLVIHNINKFAALLNDAVLAESRFAKVMVADDVRYYDTLFPDEVFPQIFDSALSLYFYKDFRYAYQAEYRFVWPVGEGDQISPIDLELGSLQDVCELLALLQ